MQGSGRPERGAGDAPQREGLQRQRGLLPEEEAAHPRGGERRQRHAGGYLTTCVDRTGSPEMVTATSPLP